MDTNEDELTFPANFTPAAFREEKDKFMNSIDGFTLPLLRKAKADIVRAVDELKKKPSYFFTDVVIARVFVETTESVILDKLEHYIVTALRKQGFQDVSCLSTSNPYNNYNSCLECRFRDSISPPREE